MIAYSPRPYQCMCKAYAYVAQPPAPARALSVALVREHINATVGSPITDSYIELMIDAVTDYFQRLTGYYIINTTLKTYRDRFPLSRCFQLNRMIAQPSTVVIEYLKDNVLTTVDAQTYYTEISNWFARVHINENESWPSDSDNRAQSITITYTAGFGASESDVPPQLRIALLNHIAALVGNRGDCSDEGCSEALPASSADIYNRYIKLDVTCEKLSCECNANYYYPYAGY